MTKVTKTRSKNKILEEEKLNVQKWKLTQKYHQTKMGKAQLKRKLKRLQKDVVKYGLKVMSKPQRDPKVT